MEKYLEEYEKWCNSKYIDSQTKSELKSITDIKEIKDRFYKDISFGTGGVRGIIAAGTNRINKYTILKVTQGIAEYLKKKYKKNLKVAIAYDNRKKSYEFSEIAALCFNGNDIETFRFESLRPTPELSFAVRNIKCCLGIVITASHNPCEYNGYKVYDEEGVQITEKMTKELIDNIKEIRNFSCVKVISHSEAVDKNLYHVIGKEVDDLYVNEIKKINHSQSYIERFANSISIVYSPLNGTGSYFVKRILHEVGFNNLYVVPEQEWPDEDFATIQFPNPEKRESYTYAIELAKKIKADLVLITDSDADRLGVCVKDNISNEYVILTGNMIGLLLTEYELSRKKELGLLSYNNGIIATTIVSSKMGKEIAQNYNVDYIETLTGFKYIGEIANNIDKNDTGKSYDFIVGYEESGGSLLGTYVRDKDACASAMKICEAAAYYKSQNLSLWDKMQLLYKKYGYYKEYTEYLYFSGIKGLETIKKFMSFMRNSNFGEFGAFRIKNIYDYKKQKKLNLDTGLVDRLDLPSSNVIFYELENQSWFCLRPSGTEAALKLYFGVKSDSSNDSEKLLCKLRDTVLALINEFKSCY